MKNHIIFFNTIFVSSNFDCSFVETILNCWIHMDVQIRMDDGQYKIYFSKFVYSHCSLLLINTNPCLSGSIVVNNNCEFGRPGLSPEWMPICYKANHCIGPASFQASTSEQSSWTQRYLFFTWNPVKMDFPVKFTGIFTLTGKQSL